MPDQFLPFTKPYINEAAIEEVVDSIQSGWLTTGPKVAKFEAALAAYVQAPHALTVSSATAGLHLALLALELEPGDEVITTPLTFVATANVIALSGAVPRFVDIDPHTFNLDLNQLESAINDKTKVIMPVHFAGLPVDLNQLYKIADQHGLRVIEDAAHAIGTEFENRKIGERGDIQVFSFHPNKNMTTGEGGCVITRDDALAKKIRVLRFHGIDRDAFNRFSKAGSQDYDVVAPGFKYNMMDIQAAIGLHQLPELSSFIEARTVIANRYLKALAESEAWQLPQFEQLHYCYRHAWHIFTPLLNENIGIDRDEFVARMKACNIGVGVHWPRPVHRYQFYQNQFGYKKGDFPISESVAARIVSLPMFPGLTEAQQTEVLDCIENILSSVN